MRLSPEREALRFLEVEEPGSPRCSVDLNLAEWRQKVGDQRALLSRLLGSTAEAEAYLDEQAEHGLGHVAAGIGRDGQPFATLYHGAHRVFGEL
jgi:tryptophan halogenase